jgi:PAS domain-containing protein
VIVAAIDQDFFTNFYRSFDTGARGGIALVAGDGTVLLRWPADYVKKSLSDTLLFQSYLRNAQAGFYKTLSPFDGLAKYFGYEQNQEYGTIVTVARTEEDILIDWRSDLVSDGLVAFLLMAIVCAMAAVLAGQFRYRTQMERSIAEREERYRLLAENIADIVTVQDIQGRFRFVSQTVVSVLGKEAGV